MKEIDLMIGDLVYLYAPDEDGKDKRYIGKVSAISNHSGLGLNGDCDIEYDVEHCDEEYFESAEPIPLTAEILEKNGWKETEFWHEYQDGKNTVQSCLPDMRGIINGVEIQYFKCEYVHQYQHLLRLCGLTELADNFQI